MILSIHQPAYLPWLGYLEKIAASDFFVFLDTVQFEKNSFINRNKIKAGDTDIWLTIPVKSKGHTSSTLESLLVDDSQPWRTKHLKSIHHNYSGSKNFNILFPELQKLIQHPSMQLADLCLEQLYFWLDQFKIKTKIIRASTNNFKGQKSDLILNICQTLGATTYISGQLGKNYLDEPSFINNGIDVKYQNFICPQYRQIGNSFINNLSVVDFLMNNTPNSIILPQTLIK